MLPKRRSEIVCALCGLQVHPLVARYLWFGLGWRGRPSPKPHTTSEFTLCGPCADTVLERLSPYVAPVKLPTGRPE